MTDQPEAAPPAVESDLVRAAKIFESVAAQPASATETDAPCPNCGEMCGDRGAGHMIGKPSDYGCSRKPQPDVRALERAVEMLFNAANAAPVAKEVNEYARGGRSGGGGVMTRDEFEKRYAESSHMTVQQLRDDLGRVVVICRCGSNICEGWASINKDDAAEYEARWK